MKLEKINNDIFLGNYKILQKIGNGSFSNVFKCEHKDTKKIFAVKHNASKLNLDCIYIRSEEVTVLKFVVSNSPLVALD